MRHVVSKDGTPIAYECSGDGPAVVLVGGLVDRPENVPLAEVLAGHFTVYIYEPRGRAGRRPAAHRTSRADHLPDAGSHRHRTGPAHEPAPTRRLPAGRGLYSRSRACGSPAGPRRSEPHGRGEGACSRSRLVLPAV